MTSAGTVRYCRKCESPLAWDEKRKRWKSCRNGCSQVTAAIPCDVESAYAEGNDAEGRSVSGDAIRRRAVRYDD